MSESMNAQKEPLTSFSSDLLYATETVRDSTYLFDLPIKTVTLLKYLSLCQKVIKCQVDEQRFQPDFSL